MTPPPTPLAACHWLPCCCRHIFCNRLTSGTVVPTVILPSRFAVGAPETSRLVHGCNRAIFSALRRVLSVFSRLDVPQHSTTCRCIPVLLPILNNAAIFDSLPAWDALIPFWFRFLRSFLPGWDGNAASLASVVPLLHAGDTCNATYAHCSLTRCRCIFRFMDDSATTVCLVCD